MMSLTPKDNTEYKVCSQEQKSNYTYGAIHNLPNDTESVSTRNLSSDVQMRNLFI